MFIELRKAMKKYGEGDALVHALDNAEISLEKGEIVVILGPSGSGKSTMMNMIGGIDKLDSGEIFVDGNDISRLKFKELTEYRRENIGFVFQFYNLIQDLTVAENVEVVSDISKHPLNTDEVLEALDIKKYSTRFPQELSGGQQQRVAIARALIKNPKILLCDELTGALDSASSREVLKYIEKVNARFGTTILIITHNDAIKEMADRIITLRDGRVTENILNNDKKSVEELRI